MKMITKKLRGLVFCLTLLAAFALCGKEKAFAADNVIYMTIEKFSIGGGFMMEPTVVPIKANDTYATLIQRVLKDDLHKTITHTGDDSDFYLSGIAGEGITNPQVPSCVLDILEEVYNFRGVDPNTNSLLEEHDYTEGSGWMYYVNNEWQDGMSLVKPKNGQVCRLQYTLCLGADLQGYVDPRMASDSNGSMKVKTYYKTGNKSSMIIKMAQMNQKGRSSWTAAETSVYNNAVKVMEMMDAKDDDVRDALYLLNNPVVLDVDKPGGNTGNTESLSLSLDKTSLPLKVGAFGSIGYTVSPDSASVTWTSSDPGVATVEGHATGALVTAKTPGTATITATAMSGSQTKTASCTVTVTGGTVSDEEFQKGSPTVTVKEKNASSVTISWDPYFDAESYIVQRKGIGETPKQIATVAGDTTSYTDKTVKAGTYYSYSVVAVKGELESEYDPNCSVTTPKADEQKPTEAKPGKASIKSVTSAAYNKLKITWGAVDGAAGYYVLRSTSKNGTYKKVGTVSTTSYTDSSLTAGKTYYYKVQAYNDGEKGALSAAKSGKPVPAAPKVSVTAGKKQATVKWNKISGASGYVVYRSTSKSKGYKTVKTVAKGSTVSYKNTKLASKKTWYYKVRAYRTVSGKKVYSAYSNVVKVTVK